MSLNKSGKTALVLAGGGLTGAVYEIGALRAIDDLLVDRTVNDFDIFVGTSAGALVSALLANGMSPEEMLSVMDGSNAEMMTLKRKDVFGLNREDFVRWGSRLPVNVAKALSTYLANINDMTLFDLIWSLSEALPPGLYDGLALERFVRDVIQKKSYANRFERIARNLFIIATELDTGNRVVFSKTENSEVPISLAVAASSALPIVYRPVRIGDNEYVDGGLRGTASLDVAIEQGATLVVCINPMVPFDNTAPESQPSNGQDRRRLSSKGIQSIANQTLRIVSHAGLHYHIKQLRRSHPEVDIILIEPMAEDYQMFFYNIMRYSARLIVARHGFESVTLNLAVDYQYYKQILARHGIPISRRLVIEELAEILESDYDTNVIRKVLEARSAGCGQRKSTDPLCELTRSLAELELALDSMAAEPDREVTT
jgi:predicted acylesterase/phospholipase RssA